MWHTYNTTFKIGYKHGTCFMQREYHCIPEDTTCPVSLRNTVSINYWYLIEIDTATLEKIDILFFQANFNDIYFCNEKLHIHRASTCDGWTIAYERNSSNRSGTSEGHTLHRWRGKGALKTCKSVQILILTSSFYLVTTIGSMDTVYYNMFRLIKPSAFIWLVTFICVRPPVFLYWTTFTY